MSFLLLLIRISSTNLAKPIVQQDSIVVAMLLDSIYRDLDFIRYPGASDRSTIKVCDSHTPSVDQPEKIADLRKYVANTLEYPKEAYNSCVSGVARVDVEIDTAGNLIGRKIWINEGDFLDYTDAFEKECWRVIESISNWKPMTFRGIKIPTKYSLPFPFELPNAAKCQAVLAQREEEREKVALNQTYIMTEEMPEFPGGEAALQQYITDQLRYPSQARKYDVSGTVFVSFTINKNGKIDEIEIKEVAISKYPDKFQTEAIRLVENMPAWNPGKIKGKPARVKYVLPIKFEP